MSQDKRKQHKETMHDTAVCKDNCLLLQLLDLERSPLNLVTHDELPGYYPCYYLYTICKDGRRCMLVCIFLQLLEEKVPPPT